MFRCQLYLYLQATIKTALTIMIIIRLLFIICGFFFFLVIGLFVVLFLKMRLNFTNTFMDDESKIRKQNYHNDGKVIQGEYKIIDEANKD